MAEPTKRQLLEEELKHGMIHVLVDATQPGVIVPDRLRGGPAVRLALSHRFDGVDIAVGEVSIQATLSFDQVPHRVSLPWRSIFWFSGANDTHRLAHVFPADVPSVLAAASDSGRDWNAKPVEEVAKPKQRPAWLRVVK